MMIQKKYSPFLSFVRKEFFHIFRDRWTSIILLIMPILMIILFGFAITTEVKNAKIAIFDPSQDAATHAIVDKLSTSEYFTIETYVYSQNEMDNLFRKRNIGLIVVFSEHFYENMMHGGDAKIQLIADGSDPNYAYTLTQYASALLGSYQQENISHNFNPPFQIETTIKMLYNPTLKGAYNTVPGVLGMVLMLICAMMTSISIAREKEFGNMEVLLVSPLKPITIILSKTVPYIVLSLINFTSIMLLAVFALKVPIVGNILLIALISLIFIFLSLALGLLISTIVKTQIVAMLISGVVLMFPVILLSGMIFPVESMGVFFQYLAKVLPANWYIAAIRKVMIQGLGISSVSKELIVLISMAVLLIAISIKKFKVRIE
ncbi:MAG: ABC transporter permease [Bacteroidales bacterium]|nr:ABC transporter permease [Bacteroidales bacterium]